MGNLRGGDMEILERFARATGIPCSGYGCTDCPVRRAGKAKCETGDEIKTFCQNYIDEHQKKASPSSGRPVDHFEVGKWYKWVGPRNTFSDSMGVMMDGVARKCELAGDEGRKDSAAFEGVPRISAGQGGQWHWFECNMKYFREVPAPGSEAKGPILERITHAIIDTVAGKSSEFDPSAIKSRSQRRAEILRGLSID